MMHFTWAGAAEMAAMELRKASELAALNKSRDAIEGFRRVEDAARTARYFLEDAHVSEMSTEARRKVALG